MRGKVLQGTAPAARGEDGQGPFRIDAEAARGITVNEHRTHLIHQAPFPCKNEIPRHPRSRRLLPAHPEPRSKLVLCQPLEPFSMRIVASRVTPPERPQIVGGQSRIM